MPDHSLPDDLNLWPQDPFAILGVDDGDDQQCVRRKYLRLAKVFKPEYRPDAFQRLREAFEAVRQALQWRQSFGGTEPEEFVVQNPEQVRGGDEGELQAATDPPLHRHTPSFRDPLDENWQDACSGDRQGAYQRLLSLRHTPAQTAHAYLQLYWLLVADPQLDPDRSPRDWLAEGLKVDLRSAQLSELYRRELLADPDEALAERCSMLLDCSVQSLTTLHLLKWRWQALFRGSHWPIIVEDLSRLRPRSQFDAERTWARIVMMAMDHLAWFLQESSAWNEFERCKSELASVSQQFHDLEWELDRVDELVLLSANWHRLQVTMNALTEWIKLIPYDWLSLQYVVQPTLTRLLQEIVKEPKLSLRDFDRLNEVSSISLLRITSLIRYQCDRTSDSHELRDQEYLEELVTQFLNAHRSQGHSLFRMDLLSFCINESISVDSVLESEAWDRYAHFETENVRNDLPLRAVYYAHQAFCG
jgi:hypothetical protein